VRTLLKTRHDWVLTLARLILGVVILPHGAQKALGVFGGKGFEATVNGMSQGMGIPPVLVMLVIAAEFIGGIMLVLGLFGRFAAFSTLLVMLGAIFLVHLPSGFFMNWSSSQKGEGIEYHLLFIGLAMVTTVKGSGALSIDRALSKRMEEAPVRGTRTRVIDART
jgi:putative oxidoreductase